MKSLLLTFLVGIGITANAADRFRTDINPALIYHQGLLMVPQLSDEDRKHLFETEWRTRPLDERATNLISTYRNVFKMLRRAAASEVPCDWGIDMSDGPETLLPSLARFKSVAQTACLRARVNLAAGDQETTREELLATIVMARNVATDQVLISCLVQIAIENIVTSFIAENFYQFTPETLAIFSERLNAGPERGSVQQSMAVEKSSFVDWLVRKITDLDAQSGGNSQVLQAKVRELWANLSSESAETNKANKVADGFVEATDGLAAGMIRYVRELEPIYEELTEILGLPWADYQQRHAEFEKKIPSHPNVLAREFFPALGNARKREFAMEAKFAMLQAAISYKLKGEAAFKAIADPFGDGPFALRRFVLDGVDRGFELESKLNCREHPEKLILIEKPGPAVRVDSKYAGQKIP
jgi:hypothetical protein